jgi:hypothetical protein
MAEVVQFPTRLADVARCLRLLVGLTQRVVFLDGRAVAVAALERLLELVGEEEP